MPRLGGIYDPVANAVAAIRYIQSRYGSIGNVASSGGY
jgi:SLT domain-containing protein